jgi:NhaP-type Na+/H+ or K+/H+ antiporter
MPPMPLVVLALFMSAYALVSRRLASTPITGPMLFVGLGVAAFLLDPGLFGTSPSGAVESVLEITLAVVLFTDAYSVSHLDWKEDTTIPGRLLGIGLPVMMVAGTLVAVLVFPGLSILEAALLGVMLAPTDAALGTGVVSNPRVPVRIRRALNVESGLNDGLALPIFFFLLEAAIAEETGGGLADVLRAILVQTVAAVAVGVVAGVGGAVLLAICNRRGWVDGGWARIFPVGIALLAWAAADAFGASGFIAAWVAGFSMGRREKTGIPDLTSFAEATGYLLTLASLVLFGAIGLGPALGRLGWAAVAYGLLSLLVIRMGSVALALAGTHLGKPTVAYVGWFGPRGLASIILAIVTVNESDLLGQSTIVSAVIATVGLSVLLHGATAWWGSNAYADWYERESGRQEMLESKAVSPPTPSRRMRHVDREPASP